MDIYHTNHGSKRPLIHPDVWFDLKWIAFLVFAGAVAWVCTGLGFLIAYTSMNI